MENEKIILFFVLNKIEKLDALLTAFNDAGIKGATVLNSIGMAGELSGLNSHEDSMIISSFRAFFTTGKTENKTIFTVIDKSRLADASSIVRSVVGDLSEPNTGVLFAMPAIYVEGIANYDNKEND